MIRVRIGSLGRLTRVWRMGSLCAACGLLACAPQTPAETPPSPPSSDGAAASAALSVSLPPAENPPTEAWYPTPLEAAALKAKEGDAGAAGGDKSPNIVVIWGDDIGQS